MSETDKEGVAPSETPQDVMRRTVVLFRSFQAGKSEPDKALPEIAAGLSSLYQMGIPENTLNYLKANIASDKRVREGLVVRIEQAAQAEKPDNRAVLADLQLAQKLGFAEDEEMARRLESVAARYRQVEESVVPAPDYIFPQAAEGTEEKDEEGDDEDIVDLALRRVVRSLEAEGTTRNRNLLTKAAEGDPDALSEMVGIAVAMGESPAIIKRYREVLKRSPGRAVELIPVLQALVNRDKSNPSAHLLTADVYRRVGDYERASEEYKTYLRLPPPSA